MALTQEQKRHYYHTLGYIPADVDRGSTSTPTVTRPSTPTVTRPSTPTVVSPSISALANLSIPTVASPSTTTTPERTVVSQTGGGVQDVSEDWIRDMYQNVLGVTNPDQAGIDYWRQQLLDPGSPVNLDNFGEALRNAAGEITNIPELYRPDLFPWARTGLGEDYVEQLMSVLVPELTTSLEDLPGQIDTYTSIAQESATAQSRDMLQDVLQNLTNQLNVRGVLDSSITGDIIGTATGNVLKNLSNQALQAGMEGAKLKLSIPTQLAQIAELGKVSQQEDPSVPQRVLASIFSAL